MRIILITLSFTLFTTLLSQDSIKFVTTIFVKDAIGNIDSVIVGTSFYANNILNSNFGEVDLQSPYDSLLEIRAGHSDGPWDFLDSDYILSRKIISRSEREEGKGGVGIRLFIYAKYQPITISWSKDFLDSQYFLGTFITSDAHYAVVSPDVWMMNPIRFQCMNKFTDYTIELTSKATPEFEFPFYVMKKIEGSSNPLDSILGVEIVFSQSEIYSPCRLISNIIEEKHINNSLFVRPNPVIDFLQMEESIIRIEIFNINGQLIRIIDGTEEIYVGDLKNGLYIIKGKNRNGNILIGNFIKSGI